MHERIRNMLMKSEDPAASPAEADAARRMAEKLMKKHGISEADLAEPKPNDGPKVDWNARFDTILDNF